MEKKFGQGKVDPQKQRATNEKVTDGIRGQFEKMTGKHVPDKVRLHESDDEQVDQEKSKMC